VDQPLAAAPVARYRASPKAFGYTPVNWWKRSSA